MKSLFDQIGGDTLRTILIDFYDRLVNDDMIGFFFSKTNIDHLVEREWEFVAQILGGDVTYHGRSLEQAHRTPAPILIGHFNRRLQILRETLDDHNVTNAISSVWLDHNISLRNKIVKKNSPCA